MGHYFRAWAAEALHDLSAAVDAARTALQCSEQNIVMYALLGRALAVAGDIRGARAVLDGIMREDPALARYGYEAALIELGLGDDEQAIALLERAHAHRSEWRV